MITKSESTKMVDKMIDNMRVANFIDKAINLPKLPKGWSVAFPCIHFCKVCRKPILSWRALKSPGGKSYYHFTCILRSKLFIKQLAREL